MIIVQGRSILLEIISANHLDRYMSYKKITKFLILLWIVCNSMHHVGMLVLLWNYFIPFQKNSDVTQRPDMLPAFGSFAVLFFLIYIMIQFWKQKERGWICAQIFLVWTVFSPYILFIFPMLRSGKVAFNIINFFPLQLISLLCIYVLWRNRSEYQKAPLIHNFSPKD